MRILLAALILITVTAAPHTPAHAAEPITGRWVTEDGEAVVTLAPCGSALCGTITRYLKTPPDGVDQRDIHNPNKALRGRKILGSPILTGFVVDGNVWRGRIYDPRRGKTYRSVLRRKDARTLEIKGCYGPICQTHHWRAAR